MKKIVFLGLFLLGLQNFWAQEQDQQGHDDPKFKFGWGILGYTRALDIDFADHFSGNGLSSYVEFGGVFKTHYEVGLRIGGHFLFTNGIAGKTLEVQDDAGQTVPVRISGSLLINFDASPYFRYYFLENPNLRPYVLGALGYSINLGWGYAQDVNTEKSNSPFYTGSFLSARAGGGIRLMKLIDLGANYYFGGLLSKFRGFDNSKVPVSKVYKENYYVHLFEINFALTFGGNISERKAKDKK